MMRVVIELPDGFTGEATRIGRVPELGSGDVLYIKITRATERPITDAERAPQWPKAEG